MTLPEIAAEARRMAEKHRNASDAPYTNGATHQRAHADAADDFCRLAAMAEPKPMTELQQAAYDLGRRHTAQYQNWITGEPHKP